MNAGLKVRFHYHCEDIGSCDGGGTCTQTHTLSAESATLNNEDNDSVQGVEERPTADRNSHTSQFLWYIYGQR